MKAELIMSDTNEYALILCANKNILYDSCQWCVYDKTNDKLYRIKGKNSASLTLSQNQIETKLKGKEIICVYTISRKSAIAKSNTDTIIKESYQVWNSFTAIVAHQAVDKIYHMDDYGIITELYKK